MKRTVIICARFTEAEAAQIDAARNKLTRTYWLRWITLRELRKEKS